MNLRRLLDISPERVRLRIWDSIWARLPELRLVRTTENGTFYFSSKDQVIGRQLFIQGGFEEQFVHDAIALATTLGYISAHNSGYLIDIGANIGTVCISLVKKGVFSSALAFEPEPRNYRLLLRNIKANGLTHAIRPFNYALSCTEGYMELEVSPINYGDHRVRVATTLSEPPRMQEDKRRTTTVPVKRLDQALSTLGIPPQEVKLIWIDVQGHEKHVLEGALRAIESGVPVVSEFWPYGLSRAGTSPEIFADFVASRFTTIYDLRELPPRERKSFQLPDVFETHGPESHTDLLLVNRRDVAAPAKF